MFRRAATVVGVVTMFSTWVVAHNVDYWSENFNKDKNCEDIQTLSTLGTAQCETVAITDGVERAFSKCIIHLEHILAGMNDSEIQSDSDSESKTS